MVTGLRQIKPSGIDNLQRNGSVDTAVTLQHVDIITIGETEGDNPLVWKVEGNKLSIDFCEESIFGGLLLGRTAPKDLAISVPQDWQCRNLCVDSASSRLLVQDLTIRKVEIDSASGTSEFVNCTVEELNVDAASGDVRFEGNLRPLPV